MGFRSWVSAVVLCYTGSSSTPTLTGGEGEGPEATAGKGNDRVGMSGLSSLNYKVEKDRDDDGVSHMQMKGSCQGCHGVYRVLGVARAALFWLWCVV